MKKWVLLLLVFFFCFEADAQVRRTLHQTFSIADAASISLELRGNVVVKEWGGNRVMTETTIEFTNAPKTVLEHFIAQDRYALELTDSGGNLVITSNRTATNKVRFKGRECYEFVTIIVYIPKSVSVTRVSSKETEVASNEDDELEVLDGN